MAVAVAGLGAWGREILAAAGRTPSVCVSAICDIYEAAITRAASGAPNAEKVTDWRRLLELPHIEAIIVATPPGTHRDIAVGALQAGKHVYCEAPLAASIEDARAIARASRDATGVVFQAGLQGRANALYLHVKQFVKSGVLGDVAAIHGQWNRRDSWRRTAPTAERESALNWRLAKGSPGLVGEAAIHQLDLMSMYLDARPAAVIGAGSIVAWRDARETPDTATCLIEFPHARATFRTTLASSFGGAYTVFQGGNSSLLLKESHGWLIKEADSPLLGWEVYARKERVHDETGIAMVADATKLLETGRDPGKDGPHAPEKPALVLALESFGRAIRERVPSACGAEIGYAATVAALKANEAVRANGRVEIQPSDYTV